MAKSLTFSTKDGGAFLVVAAGDPRVDNGKFRVAFGDKPSMLVPEGVSA